MNKNKLLAILLLCIVGYVALTPGMMKTVTQVFASPSKASQSLSTSIAPINAATNGDYSVVGSPTINVAGIDKVLSIAQSPAQGTGEAMYAYGVRYGIDPVFALAFFQHESTFGRNGIAATNLGLGNIRCSQGFVCINGFRAYSSWGAGYADWYKLIRYQYVNAWKLTTVAQIVPVYAPSSENNPTQYIASVESAAAMWRGQK